MKPAFIALLLLVTAIGVADAGSSFPLLGLWRVSSGTTANGDQVPANEQMELEFLHDGVLVVTAVSPGKGITKPIRMRWSYTFQPPDVVTYTFSGTAVERQRFKVVGDLASFEHLDYKTTSKLRRIKKSEFTEQPKDVQDFPQ